MLLHRRGAVARGALGLPTCGAAACLQDKQVLCMCMRHRYVGGNSRRSCMRASTARGAAPSAHACQRPPPPPPARPPRTIRALCRRQQGALDGLVLVACRLVAPQQDLPLVAAGGQELAWHVCSRGGEGQEEDPKGEGAWVLSRSHHSVCGAKQGCWGWGWGWGKQHLEPHPTARP